MADGRQLAGRVAIVTGGGRGLGRAIAVGLARAGADITLASRGEDELAAAAEIVAAEGQRVLTVPTDVTDATQVERLVSRTVEHLGGVDILVNNSGTFVARRVIHTTEEEWDHVIDTNLKGVFLCTRAVGGLFSERRAGGVVVNISSNLGLVGRSHFAAYCASKAAVINFTRAVALEWAPMGARINCIAPGYFETQLNAKLRADAEAAAGVLDGIPQRRMGLPHEIAPLAVFLASDSSAFMTGETIVLDGGESLD